MSKTSYVSLVQKKSRTLTLINETECTVVTVLLNVGQSVISYNGVSPLREELSSYADRIKFV